MRNSDLPRHPRHPHNWLATDRYFTIHEESLRRLESYAIVENNLATIFRCDRVRIPGVLLCHGGISLFVRKLLTVNELGQVRGLQYTYQAQLFGLPVRRIFRYDNAHQYTIEGYPDAFHKHVWNYRTWQEIEPPQWIGHYHWPTLAQVVEAVWTGDHRFTLRVPDVQS